MDETPMNSLPDMRISSHMSSLWDPIFPESTPSLDGTMAAESLHSPKSPPPPHPQTIMTGLMGSITTNPTKTESHTDPTVLRNGVYPEDQYDTDDSYSSDDSYSTGGGSQSTEELGGYDEYRSEAVSLDTLNVEFTYYNKNYNNNNDIATDSDEEHGRRFLWASAKIDKGQECVYIVDIRARTIQFLAARRSIELPGSNNSSSNSRGLVAAVCSKTLPGKYEWKLGAVVDSGEHSGVWVCVWPLWENQLPENMREKVVDIVVDEGDYGFPCIDLMC